MHFPKPDPLDKFVVLLAKMVAETSWLPNPRTVKLFKTSVFPTVRAKKNFPRHTPVVDQGTVVGMYDDNASPQWALQWAHALEGTRPKGWTVAHVWPRSSDITAYTHLANLALVAECFGSLTDKNGALTSYLRFHAHSVYDWKPKNVAGKLEKPEGFDSIEWRYLPHAENPEEAIKARMSKSKDKRIKRLSEIMEALSAV